MISILVNYFLGEKITLLTVSLKKNILFYVGLLFNLGILGYFKYVDFFLENIAALSGAEIALLNVILPLGISFFSLQQVIYIVDSFQGQIKKTPLLDYSIFVSFFPQLIAGPIVHHRELIPQLQENKFFQISSESCMKGLFILSLGLFKKVFIADSLSSMVKMGFDISTELTFIEAWVSSLCYTCQLYFDFSGYSDMAIGMALLFNLDMPLNFNSPFKSRNIIEFWQKWHITLSRFITTYLYTPLVRSLRKITFGGSLVMTFLAMTIAGLWHGASWNYVIFGMMHGGALVINHFFKKKKIKLPRILATSITFIFVNCSFVVFRATSLEAAAKIFKGMFVVDSITLPISLSGVLGFLKNWGVIFSQSNIISMTTFYQSIFILPLMLWVLFFTKPTVEMAKGYKTSVKYIFYTSILLVLSCMQLGKVKEFLYFNF